MHYGAYRQIMIACSLLALSVAGCTSDCLPAPESDTTPPNLEVVVEYRSSQDGNLNRHEASTADSSVTLLADRNSPVHIRYAAVDSSGMRQLVPGLTIHQTVGIGVERQHVEIGPIDASCPRPRLDGDHEVHGTGVERVLIISAGAVNWTGLRTSIEPVSVRLE